VVNQQMGMSETPNSSSLRLIAIVGIGLMGIGLSGLYVGLGRKVDRRLGAAALELTAKPCLTERLGSVQPVTEPLVMRRGRAATLSATLQGTKGAGQMQAELELEGQDWRVRRAEVKLAGGTTLDLLTCEPRGGLLPDRTAGCDARNPCGSVPG
jgi:hypothetical protein